MAYVAPVNRSTGDLITSAIWNADVVANPIALYAGAMSIASQAAEDLILASSATQLKRLGKTNLATLVTNGTGVASWLAGVAAQYLRLNSGGTAFEFAAIPSAPVVGYAATLTNVDNTAAETTFLSFDVPANAWNDGDPIWVYLDNYLKNNKGTSGTTTVKCYVGSGAAVQLLAQAHSDDATEYNPSGMLAILQRTGGTVTVSSPIAIGDNAPTAPFYPAAGRNLGNSSPANFTSTVTVAFKVTLSAADATFYVHPHAARVWQLKAA